MRRRRERSNGRSGVAVRDGNGDGPGHRHGDGNGHGLGWAEAGGMDPGPPDPRRLSGPSPAPPRCGSLRALAAEGGQAFSCGQPWRALNKGLGLSTVGEHGMGSPGSSRSPVGGTWEVLLAGPR